MLTKEYLGEVALPLDDWFIDKLSGKERSFGFDQPGNEVSLYYYLSVKSTYLACMIVLPPQTRLHPSEYSFYWYHPD